MNMCLSPCGGNRLKSEQIHFMEYKWKAYVER